MDISKYDKMILKKSILFFGRYVICAPQRGNRHTEEDAHLISKFTFIRALLYNVSAKKLITVQ